MRIGLGEYLVVVGVLGAAIGLYARYGNDQVTAGSDHTTAKGSPYDLTVWLRRGELYYCVLRPKSFPSGNWCVGGHTPGTRDVDLVDAGIYLKGKRVPMTARVFVYTVDKTMRPIPLTDEELGQLLPPAPLSGLRRSSP